MFCPLNTQQSTNACTPQALKSSLYCEAFASIPAFNFYITAQSASHMSG